MIRNSNPGAQSFRGIACLASLLLAAACQDREEVKIGAVVPLTGPSAIYGGEVAKGIELAFEQLKTRPAAPESFELEMRDSQSDPQKAREALEAVYEEGARAAIGGITTEEALAMVPVAENRHRVLVSPSSSAQELSGVSREFYRVWTSDSREGSLMGQYAAQNLDLDTAVVLAAETSFAEGIQEVFQTAFTRAGGEVVESIRYPVDTEELASFVKQAVAAKPSGIYVADHGSRLVEAIRLLRQQGFRGKILTVSALAAPEALAAAGKAAEGVVVTHPPFSPQEVKDPQVKEFVEAYRARFGETPSLYAAHGYDSMLVIFEALQQGGETGASFWKGMRSIQDLAGVTGPIQFDERGDVAKFPRVYVVKKGQTVDYATVVKEEEEEIRRRIEQLRRQRRELQERIGG